VGRRRRRKKVEGGEWVGAGWLCLGLGDTPMISNGGSVCCVYGICAMARTPLDWGCWGNGVVRYREGRGSSLERGAEGQHKTGKRKERRGIYIVVEPLNGKKRLKHAELMVCVLVFLFIFLSFPRHLDGLLIPIHSPPRIPPLQCFNHRHVHMLSPPTLSYYFHTTVSTTPPPFPFSAQGDGLHVP
jgi:hypothetical protein